MQSIFDNIIALLGFLVATTALAHSIISTTKSRKIEEYHSRMLNTPDVSIIPRFQIEPTNNRLVVQIHNLHSSIAAKVLRVSCKIKIEFKEKEEAQDTEITLGHIMPGAVERRQFPGIFCDFNPFIANYGKDRFEETIDRLSTEEKAAIISRIKQDGYLKKGQPPVGELILKWSYEPAHTNGQRVFPKPVSYPLFIWQYDHGVYLDIPDEEENAKIGSRDFQ